MKRRAVAFFSITFWALQGCGSERGSSEVGPDPAAEDAGPADAGPADTAELADADASLPKYDLTVHCARKPCATAVTASAVHACALLDDGSIRCWGSNESGQLGIGVTGGAGRPGAFRAKPQPVRGIVNAASVAAAYDPGSSGGQPTAFTCALLRTGQVSCFGSNAFGQLGAGPSESTAQQFEPTLIENFQAKSIALGGSYGMALDPENKLWTWGTNVDLQLAQKDAPPLAPARADLLASAIGALSGTPRNAFAVDDAGRLLSWGAGTDEQLGRPTSLSHDPIPRPIVLPDTPSVSAVAAGAAHACALGGGAIHCWGQNKSGQLGVLSTTWQPLPVRVAFTEDIEPVAIAAGGNDTCVIAANGKLYCWGDNKYGQLGLPVSPTQWSPVRMEGVEEDIVGVAILRTAICALLRSGTIVCRGSNSAGQLGRGTADIEPHLEFAPVALE